jgi:glycosyltransferase involved in cell wall biosynthesis
MDNISNAPLVSIIIPMYNAEKYMDRTIQSVLNQSYANWELIIINDGSTDHSVSVCEKYTNEKIKCFSQQNKGVSAARNYGVSKAVGGIIAFLDADDYWMEDNLFLKVTHIMHSDSDYVYSNFKIINATDVFIKNGAEGTDIDILKNLLLWERDVIPGACSNLVLKSACLNTMRFDENFSTAADQDFCFRLSAKYKGAHINAFTWYYRVYATSMSRNPFVLAKDHIAVYKKAHKLKLFHSFLFRLKCFSNMYLIMAGNWWVNGKNKWKGLHYIFIALLYYPLNALKLLRKIF